MTPRVIGAATVSGRPRASVTGGSRGPAVDFATLGRAPLRLGFGSRRVTSRDLQIREATEELLDQEVPEPEGVAHEVSLLKGFNATIPSAEKGRTRRRQTRNVDTPKLGLKRISMGVRGMLEDEDHDGESVVSEDDVVMVGASDRTLQGRKGKRKGRQSLSASKVLGTEELTRQTHEIQRDKENLHVRRALIHNEIDEISHRIEALDAIRSKLGQDLLKLQEEELELDDELVGVRERLELEESSSQPARSLSHSGLLPHTSRRRKGPAFLPSEHDDLPPGVAFMTLESHTTPITALDFSEPYGTLVTASQDDTQPRVWDLLSGEEIGRLRGHRGTVKCIQVEDHICLTGSEDSTVRVWDLRRVDEDEEWESGDMLSLSDVAEEDEAAEEQSIRQGGSSSSRPSSVVSRDGPCVRTLEGHTKAVSTMYFEDECLVTGASDKTMRQWDLNTGQCVMTMDILWAISHPPASTPGTALPAHLFPAPRLATPPYSDGTWEMYQDFVGAVQFWGYALVSGSGDGAVRMWDMRTGQPHRTLLGHTAPVTSLQFDELHIVSGSLDKSIGYIWDVRTGGIFETLKYDHAVTALQFDTRKIVAATGENGIKIYNRTSMQHSTLLTNGHTRPAERLRYMDRTWFRAGATRLACISHLRDGELPPNKLSVLVLVLVWGAPRGLPRTLPLSHPTPGIGVRMHGTAGLSEGSEN
ncbi:WD40 repeat-like protein [Epithele typhae]|uniref:WD40 repeat-like protein n=1 Tax=Epithele typhae TaxID=378194 RepID=UPI002008E336|nr:WD40 repeat-like protein [Epithele typhae]KAH9927496.1 WD40 repeat-like protein [Epithele typhae]